ncbi:MAG: hypothetical protein KME08_16300 [Aphanothece sp. CMT-3BRIN-NPC111]|jgi:hypothetical protein|nr:hypothetical protein [Aphanothece sp. CMT-3BRIN-NPC111]
MLKVLIVVEDEQIAASSTTERMVTALKQAIAAIATQPPLETVQVVAAAALSGLVQELAPDKHLWCPLTLNLPESLDFPGQEVYRACRNVPDLRQWVKQKQSIATGNGNLWLPVVLTAKGPLYGEVIGLAAEVSTKELSEDLSLPREGSDTLPYQQPVHLSDVWRQPLYQLAHQLLQFLAAPPATYLLQFGLQEQGIVFDRLWPFPGAPAIASLGVQTPDLFNCHWQCLTGKPIFDLTIIPPMASIKSV